MFIILLQFFSFDIVGMNGIVILKLWIWRADFMFAEWKQTKNMHNNNNNKKSSN